MKRHARSLLAAWASTWLLQLAACAAFETRPLCDGDVDCAAERVCTAGFCVDASNGVGGPEPSVEPGASEPSVSEPEPSPAPSVPSPEADPEPDTCPTPSCGCEETAGPVDGVADGTLVCSDAIAFQPASDACHERGLPPLFLLQDQVERTQNWAFELGLTTAWTGLSFDGEMVVHDSFPDLRLSPDVFAWGEAAPTPGLPSCILLNAETGLQAHACNEPHAFLCGDFSAVSEECGPVDVDSDPNHCGACFMRCLNFQCASGHCASVTRATDIIQVEKVIASVDVYWVMHREGQLPMLRAYRLPDSGAQAAISLGDLQFVDVGRTAKGPDGSVVALIRTDGDFRIVNGTAGDGVNTSTLASNIAVSLSNFGGPLVTSNLRWFTAGTSTVLLSGGLLGGDAESLIVPAVEGDAIGHLAVAGGVVLVGFEGSGETRAVLASNFSLSNAAVESLPGPFLALSSSPNRFVAVFESGGAVKLAWIEDLTTLVDADGGAVRWIELGQELPLQPAQIRDLVVIGDTAYLAGPQSNGIFAVSLVQSAPSLTVASGDVVSLDAVDGILVWATSDGVVHELLPPVYSP